ncbi:IS200/IS605 family transposase [Nonomuraea sp. NPDC000554]|uniref:IS200/IS605 family transposase n=1 Tax=Nonomuraea sp. NPDC000554 TaxID=3154259 RepID=UPI0033184462
MRPSPSAAYDLGYHVVRRSKYWRRVVGGWVKTRLEELIRAKAAEHEWEIIASEVMPDHMHLFVKSHPKRSTSYVANQFNGSTSPHLRSRLPSLWSRSYVVASVGAVSVRRCIEAQYERVPNSGGAGA